MPKLSKQCPACKEKIHPAAAKCRFCNAEFSSKTIISNSSGLTKSELQPNVISNQDIKSSAAEKKESSVGVGVGVIILLVVLGAIFFIVSSFSMSKEELNKMSNYPIVYQTQVGPASTGASFADLLGHSDVKVVKIGSLLYVSLEDIHVICYSVKFVTENGDVEAIMIGDDQFGNMDLLLTKIKQLNKKTVESNKTTTPVLSSTFDDGNLGKNIQTMASIKDRGMKYLKDGAWDKAANEFGKIIINNPRDFEAYHLQGICYTHINVDVAITFFTKSIEINPNFAEAHYSLGAMYLRKGDLNQAVEEASYALRINSNLSEAYSLRGQAYRKLHKTDQAIADLTKAIEIDPSNGMAVHNRALAYQLKGDYAHAIEDATRAIELNPNNGAAFYVRGMTYFSQKEYGKSWEDIHKAASLGVTGRPEDIEALKKASGREN